MRRQAIFLSGLLAFAGLSASAHEFKVGDLVIDHPYSFATPPSASTGAGYMTVTNYGINSDRLVAVKSDMGHAMLHESKVVEGVMTMSHQTGGVDIPAGSTVSFEPGGLHVMFMHLSNPMKEGKKFETKLIFEEAGEVIVEFKIDKRNQNSAEHKMTN